MKLTSFRRGLFVATVAILPLVMLQGCGGGAKVTRVDPTPPSTCPGAGTTPTAGWFPTR